ncbi:MAG: trypsin-like serine protease [Ignavibacteria bacterium]|jgi:hypothetical protein
MSDSQLIKHYQDLIAKYKKEFLETHLVHGISVGYKSVGGQETDQIALVAFVYEKLDTSHLKENEIFRNVVAKIDTEIATDVVVMHRPMEWYLNVSKAVVDVTENTATYRPLIGGCRIANESELYYHHGTLGFVADSTTSKSQKCVVTNAHIVKNSMDNKIYQASVSKTEYIGNVGNTAYSAKVDGAQIKVTSGVETVNKILEIGNVGGTKNAELNEVVQKYGYTTLLTEGKITNLSYAGTSVGGREFEDQIIISKVNSSDPPLGTNGDSGAAVVNKENNKIVGLLWGGENDGSKAYASPIADVESELSIKVSTD